ncbi:MAG: CYTH domain-containing protein, partial [Dehalococcoidia bacterium]
MSGTYEIEIKSLLGESSEAERVREGMRALDPNATCRASYTQINHYFENGDITKLVEALTPLVSSATADKMGTIAEEGRSLSIRTRSMNGESRIVMKASIGDDSSANGVARLEIEEPVTLALDALDQLVLSCGYTYQAKWSRSREEYQVGDVTVCLDKNAGYGYLAEFEKVVENPDQAPEARAALDDLMRQLGVVELP